MALPAADTAAGIPASVCCDTLSAMANRVRTVAMDGLCQCVEETCADRTFRSYVTIGPGVQDPLGDSLIVYLSDFGATTGSTDQRGNLLGIAVYQADFEMRLLENGWPQIRVDEMTGQIVAPDADYIHAVAMHSTAHGERMYRALADAIQRKEMFVGSANDHIGNIQLSGLTPIQPSAFMAGWKCTIRVEAILR